MFDIADSLSGPLSAAGQALGEAASATARAQTPYGGSRTDAAMAGVAEHALFTEVLLNAVHARLAEIKNATRA